MSQNMRVLSYAVGMFFALAAPAMAADGAAMSVSALGAGLAICGAGYGIGRVGQAALEGMARQPEIVPKLQLGMLIAAAFIEGVTLFALIICIAK